MPGIPAGLHRRTAPAGHPHKKHKIYFRVNIFKYSRFFPAGKSLFYRLKIEHSAYMLTALIVYVEILRNFDCFFNGGFS